MISYNHTNVNDALPRLLGDLLKLGDEVGSRLGERTMELTQIGITLDKPWQREIVLPERKANIAAQIVETMWVLSGRNDIAGLLPYLPRAADFSDDGVEWRSGYGPRLRNYHGVDQLSYIVDLLQRSPGSRQAVATIWDPTVDTEPGKDIACNNWLSFISRLGRLDLHVAIRSNDVMWGWSGINAFEWSTLLEVVAVLTGLEVGSLHFSVTSFHLYDRHWAKARLLSEQGGNFLYNDSPRFDGPETLDDVDDLIAMWFTAEAQIRTGQPVDVEAFPEPLLRSWLRVLQWYWSADVSYLQPLRHTRLYEACRFAAKPAGEPQPVSVLAEPSPTDNLPTGPSFLDHVNALHAEKHAAYGDSWKRRGEPGILGNIARKIDRIGSGLDTSDETQADTAIDLLVYLAKMRCWLISGAGDPEEVEVVLSNLKGSDPGTLISDFEFLETLTSTDQKVALVDTMLEQAFSLAKSLW